MKEAGMVGSLQYGCTYTNFSSILGVDLEQANKIKHLDCFGFISISGKCNIHKRK